MTLAGFVLTIAAASMWAMGNIVTRKVGKVNLVGLVVWGSLVPPLPFFALSWMLEGPATIETALRGISLDSVLALVYLAFGATILGYGLWSRLLSRYPTGQVAPFSLLVPVVGLSSSAWLLGEHLSVMQVLGAVVVMLGLLINVFGARLAGLLRPLAS
jgi:O-acetylserine/cysteine efflux transporter